MIPPSQTGNLISKHILLFQTYTHPAELSGIFQNHQPLFQACSQSPFLAYNRFSKHTHLSKTCGHHSKYANHLCRHIVTFPDLQRIFQNCILILQTPYYLSKHTTTFPILQPPFQTSNHLWNPTNVFWDFYPPFQISNSSAKLAPFLPHLGNTFSKAAASIVRLYDGIAFTRQWFWWKRPFVLSIFLPAFD